jgi:hypothetical protein
MDHHGWEFGLYSLVRIYEVSVWPACLLVAICLFRQEVRSGIKSIAAKMEHLIELRVSRSSATAKFKPPQEKVTLENISIRDS